MTPRSSWEMGALGWRGSPSPRPALPHLAGPGCSRPPTYRCGESQHCADSALQWVGPAEAPPPPSSAPAQQLRQKLGPHRGSSRHPGEAGVALGWGAGCGAGGREAATALECGPQVSVWSGSAPPGTFWEMLTAEKPRQRPGPHRPPTRTCFWNYLDPSSAGNQTGR